MLQNSIPCVQILVATLLWPISTFCSSQVYTIASTSSRCLSPPCLTLDEFAKSSNKIGSSMAIKLMLEPGNHSLLSELTISNLDSMMINTTSDKQESRIMCDNDSSRLTYSNIDVVRIERIIFLECQNIVVTNVNDLTLHSCTFLCQNVSNTVIKFNRINATINTSSFYRNMDQHTAIVSDATLIVSYTSNIVIEKCFLRTDRGSILLAESESIVNITGTSAVNSSTREVMFSSDETSALIQLSNGKLNINNCSVIQNSGHTIIHVRECEITINNSNIDNNIGKNFVFCSVKSTVYLNNVSISKNDGNFSVIYLLKTVTTIINMTFSHNFGSLLTMNSLAKFLGLNIFEHCSQILTSNTNNLQVQGTLTAIQSTIKVFNETRFLNNYSTKSGGAIYTSESIITIHNTILINNNMAEKSGGGAFLHHSNLVCHGNCTFAGNKANYSGGGVHAVSSLITLGTTGYKINSIKTISLNFVDNRAELGGGVYFEASSKLNCIIDRINHNNIDFTGNIATDGGALFVRDETYSSTCNSTSFFVHSPRTECFFQVLYNDIILIESDRRHSISIANNMAERGSVLYGGLLDRCSICPMAEVYNKSIHSTRTQSVSGFDYFLYESGGKVSRDAIASDAVRVCHCDNDTLISCGELTEVHVVKGEIFKLSVVAVDEVLHTVAALIRASLSIENILGEGQQLQFSNVQCTELTFNISSPHDFVNLVLYADQGPCRDTGLSTFTAKIIFKECKCSIGFERSKNMNICECNLAESLKPYVKAINSSSLVRTKNCWINYMLNGSEYLYFVHPKCPYDYCLLPNDSVINFNEQNGADAQCNFNRAGLLCGQCRNGYSMSLGNSHCIQCPGNWHVLAVVAILSGAIAGIALVVLVLWLHLTVDFGTFNGMIFYANIVITNHSIFPIFSKQSFFTIFINFLNTRLGVNRCFWEGMKAYDMIWFTYVFPLFIIILVIAIIITSTYSSRFAKIIGKRNPVATLATLILVSYTYLLHNTINILSYAELNYPDGTSEVVWLPDASVKYLQGEHIPLFLTAIVVVITGLIYTTLLFSWQWLQLTPNIRVFRWIRNTKLNLFIEAYHAPYKPKYRYWTGLLLLVRVAINIAVTVTVDPGHILLITGALISLIIILKAYLGDNVYKNWVLDYLECTCYINLLLLTLATFYSLRKNKQIEVAFNISIGVTFVLFIFALLYHMHYTLNRNIKRYKKICNCTVQYVKRIKRSPTDLRPLEDASPAVNDKNCAGYSSTEVALHDISREDSEWREQQTVTMIKQSLLETSSSNDLREPLL